MSYAHYAPTRFGALELSSAPASGIEVVPTTDMRNHLRIDHTEDDDYIDAVVRAAVLRAESYLNRKLITQTWTATWPDFDYATDASGVIIPLPFPPLQSVSSITYYDTNNSQQTYSSANYRTVTSRKEMGFIELDQSSSWPSLYARADAVTVTFICGYGGTASSVPEDIIHAIKLIAASFYENRESVTDMKLAEVPQSALWLLDTERHVAI